ncbi:virion structural protein [Roseobacter phage RD-1410W1-01]|uniref:Structural protein n=1 Tax=Roseobacter phage RD-1410W1-01 TaxID=1815984 RepID=A0A191VYF4_9CAUD|nr:virion structural protein [Roseobacter phage RD-1410W1-01]ANJ20739.1 structural protein [Roseobacter phage RD-1410W1-01]
MPHPIDYVGTQDDDQTRSVDITHIDPSIREGLFILPSIYGPEASRPLYRYAPFNIDAPFITGSLKLPTELLCEVGKWDGSPTPQFDFQWQADGVDIPGYTNQREDFGVEFDGQAITCEVRGYSVIGEGYGFSDPVNVSIIEPIEARALNYHVVTGLHNTERMTNFNERTLITSGMSALNRQDVVRGVLYFTTGVAADTREDINAKSVHVIQGLASDYKNRVQGNDVAIISFTGQDPLETGVPLPINLVNGDAHMGNLAWTTFGSATYNDGGTYWHTTYNYFWGGTDVTPDQNNTPYSYMYQDVELYDGWLIDVDAGTCSLEINWWQFSDDWRDQANVKVEFLDINKNVIQGNDGPGLWSSPNDVWFPRSFEAPVPANTRYVRLFMEFNWQPGDDDNDAGIDNLTAFIRKGDKVNTRDYGPTFEQWRIRFTQANTWSGCALGELEFRQTSGGADLATNGYEIAGSEANGGLALYAFDDIRNNGYWAGEENGVANGTAWIGYNMQTLVRPEEIDITARSGTNSLQMGRAFLIEGSHDGILWTPVQEYHLNDVGTFSSGQQKQFEVLSGTYDFLLNEVAGTYNTGRNTSSSDNDMAKGNIWQAKARLNLDTIRFKPMNTNTWDYRIYLVRINDLYSKGMVDEILFSSTGTTDGTTNWQEVALGQDYEFEVGDKFAVIVVDYDLVNNPNTSADSQTTEGRVSYLFDMSNESEIRNNKFCYQTETWSTDIDFIYDGFRNNHGYGIDFIYAVDFKGSIF